MNAMTGNLFWPLPDDAHTPPHIRGRLYAYEVVGHLFRVDIDWIYRVT